MTAAAVRTAEMFAEESLKVSQPCVRSPPTPLTHRKPVMDFKDSPEGLVEQARLIEGHSASCIHVTDSAGHLLPDTVEARLRAVRAALEPETELGFHAHHDQAKPARLST